MSKQKQMGRGSSTHHRSYFATLGTGVKFNNEEADVLAVKEVAKELPAPHLHRGQLAHEFDQASDRFVAGIATKTTCLTL